MSGAITKASGTANRSATSSWRKARSLRVAAISPFHEFTVARNHRSIGNSGNSTDTFAGTPLPAFPVPPPNPPPQAGEGRVGERGGQGGSWPRFEANAVVVWPLVLSPFENGAPRAGQVTA